MARQKLEGQKHGCLFRLFQDAFQVFATIGGNLLMKAPVKTEVRVINRFECVFALFRLAVFFVLALAGLISL